VSISRVFITSVVSQKFVANVAGDV
jgi:hypothetical protein